MRLWGWQERSECQSLAAGCWALHDLGGVFSLWRTPFVLIIDPDNATDSEFRIEPIEGPWSPYPSDFEYGVNLILGYNVLLESRPCNDLSLVFEQDGINAPHIEGTGPVKYRSVGTVRSALQVLAKVPPNIQGQDFTPI